MIKAEPKARASRPQTNSTRKGFLIRKNLSHANPQPASHYIASFKVVVYENMHVDKTTTEFHYWEIDSLNNLNFKTFNAIYPRHQ